MIPLGKFLSNAPEETFEFAYRFSEQLEDGAVFLLHGDLGAGKTVFTKGIAAGLAIDPADVTSPTFTIINEYQGRLTLYHIDLYRLAESSELYFELGLDEILTKPDAVVVIEWAERLGDFSFERAYHVRITILDEEKRELEIEQ